MVNRCIAYTSWAHIFATSWAVSVFPHLGPPTNIKFTGESLWATVNSFNTEGKLRKSLTDGAIDLEVKKTLEDIKRVLGSRKISVRIFVDELMFPRGSTGHSLKRLQLQPWELKSESLIPSTIGWKEGEMSESSFTKFIIPWMKSSMWVASVLVPTLLHPFMNGRENACLLWCSVHDWQLSSHDRLCSCHRINICYMINIMIRN